MKGNRLVETILTAREIPYVRLSKEVTLMKTQNLISLYVCDYKQEAFYLNLKRSKPKRRIFEYYKYFGSLTNDQSYFDTIRNEVALILWDNPEYFGLEVDLLRFKYADITYFAEGYIISPNFEKVIAITIDNDILSFKLRKLA